MVVATKVTSEAEVGNIHRTSECRVKTGLNDVGKRKEEVGIMVDKNEDGRPESEEICQNVFVKVEEGVSAIDDEHDSSDQSVSEYLSLDLSAEVADFDADLPSSEYNSEERAHEELTSLGEQDEYEDDVEDDIEDKSDNYVPWRKDTSKSEKTNSHSKSDEQSNQCRLCNEVITKHEVDVHMSLKHDLDCISCCFCLKTFDSIEHRSLHMSMNHPPRKAPRINCLECKLCNIPITKKESHDHMDIEHQKTNECAFCDYKVEDGDLSRMSTEDIADLNNTLLTTFGRFRRHINRAHRFKEPDQASTSTKEPDQASSIKKCYHCKAHLWTEELLAEHKDKNVDPSMRQVPLCLKLPKDQASSIKKCNHCKAHLETDELLAQHKDKNVDPSMRQVPLCLKLPKDQKTKRRPKKRKKRPTTICNLCGKTVAIKTISVHLAMIHDVDRGKVFKYKCLYCPNTYCRARSLKMHLLNNHLARDERNFICKICGKSYTDVNALKRHNLHHQEPSIQCPRCDRLFKSKNNVIQHIQGAHLPPQFECLACQQRFTYRSVCRNHLNKIHGITDVENSFIKKHSANLEMDLEKLKNIKYRMNTEEYQNLANASNTE